MSEPTVLQAVKRAAREVNNTIPSVNCGGCGVYAALVVGQLHRRGIRAWGRAGMFDPCRSTVDKVRSLLLEHDIRPERANARKWNDYGINFNHVLVQFEYRGKVYTHDCEFIKLGDLKREPNLGTELLPGGMTPVELKAIAGKAEGWNDCFDRAHIPRMARIIRRHLKDARA